MDQQRLPISVFIITLNEEQRIAKTILAVRDWVHEVVVVDSGSTDQTITIAEDLGACVYHHDWEGFGHQKRFAEDQCSQDWLLNVDADEIIPKPLGAEIRSTFGSGEMVPAAFKLKIHNIYPGDEKPRPCANDYNVIRLYHKSVGRYRDHPVFDRVVLEHEIKPLQLKNPIHHFPLVSLDQMMVKTTRQSNSNLDGLSRKSRALLITRLVFGFPLNFLRNYLMRGHVLGGWKGFVFALNTAYSRSMRVAKALELKDAAVDSTENISKG